MDKEVPNGKETDLAEEMRELRAHIVRINSPKRRFLLGVIAGVGTALGATIVAAPLIVALSNALTRVGLLE